jgi:putative membrane protein
MVLWLKALHLISMVAWFAGMFYVGGLLVCHAENRENPDVTAVLKSMASRVYRMITTPGMIATWLFGLAMVAAASAPLALLAQPWLIAKLLLVLGFSGYHGYVGRARRRFEADDVFLTSRQCRIRNGIPTLFLIAIVLLAVLRPGD